jgi:sugar lactone lactonase YvrE
VEGNLWCGWGMGDAQLDGVKIFDPIGKPIGFIALPERCANLCFVGAWAGLSDRPRAGDESLRLEALHHGAGGH